MTDYPHIRSFKTFQEMQEYLAEHRRMMQATIEDWQLKLKPGDTVLRHVNFYGEPLTIWAEIVQPEDDPEDLPIPNDYRLVRAYSTVEPDGELGVEPVAVWDVQIGREIFELAKSKGWPTLPLERR